MVLNLQTHKRIINKKYGFEESIPQAPYLRLANGHSPPIYIQNGQFLSEEAGALDPDNLPSWVHEQILKTNPVVLEEVGYRPKTTAKK